MSVMPIMHDALDSTIPESSSSPSLYPRPFVKLFANLAGATQGRMLRHIAMDKMKGTQAKTIANNNYDRTHGGRHGTK